MQLIKGAARQYSQLCTEYKSLDELSCCIASLTRQLKKAGFVAADLSSGTGGAARLALNGEVKPLCQCTQSVSGLELPEPCFLAQSSIWKQANMQSLMNVHLSRSQAAAAALLRINATIQFCLLIPKEEQELLLPAKGDISSLCLLIVS